MICRLRVAAGVDLKLSHSCPAEPYRASVDVFPAEWDNLSALLGAKTRWLGPSDTKPPPSPCGIWGMVMSLGWARPRRVVSVIPELRLFVGILW